MKTSIFIIPLALVICLSANFLTPVQTVAKLDRAAADSWTVSTAYPNAIARYGFAVDGENFYIVSGVPAAGVRTKAVNRYNTATGIWTSLAQIPEASESPATAVFDGRIYVAEGAGGSSPNNNFHIYDIQTNTWSSGAAVPSLATRFGAAAGAFGGKIFVGGGGFKPSNDVQVYDIATNNWTNGEAAPVPFSSGGYVQVGQYLYCVGGMQSGTSENSAATMRLDMNNGVWSFGAEFAVRRADFALAASGGKLYAVGGDASGGGLYDASNAVDELDVTNFPAGIWKPSPENLPSARQGNQAGFGSAGKIWSTGGIGANFTFLNEHLFRAAAPSLVTVSGQVTSESGKGLPRARVTMTGANGQAREAFTNQTGFYSFAEVRAGETYTFQTKSKRRRFTAQTIAVNENLSNINFTTQP